MFHCQNMLLYKTFIFRSILFFIKKNFNSFDWIKEVVCKIKNKSIDCIKGGGRLGEERHSRLSRDFASLCLYFGTERRAKEEWNVRLYSGAGEPKSVCVYRLLCLCHTSASCRLPFYFFTPPLFSINNQLKESIQLNKSTLYKNWPLFQWMENVRICRYCLHL